MARIFYALAFAAAVISIETPQVSAQPVAPVGPQRPMFSPYLGLIGNSNPGLMYYGVVRPQMQMQQQMGAMQQQLLAAQNQGQHGTSGDQANLLPPTGMVPVFNNTYGNFNRIPVGTGGTTSSGGGGGGSFNRFGPNGGSFGSGSFGSGSFGSGSQPSFAPPTPKAATFGTPPKR